MTGAATKQSILFPQMQSGLLRFARNDGLRASIRIPAARCARVMHHLVALEMKRAQGMPDAGRTREPCVQRKLHFTHASSNRAAGTAGIPRAIGVNGCFALSLECRAC